MQEDPRLAEGRITIVPLRRAIFCDRCGREITSHWQYWEWRLSLLPESHGQWFLQGPLDLHEACRWNWERVGRRFRRVRRAVVGGA